MEKQRQPEQKGKIPLKLNRQALIFLLCLVISFFIWLQFNLSKIGQDIVPVYVTLTEQPKSVSGKPLAIDTLYVEIEADGYALLQYEPISIHLEAVKLKRSADRGRYYLLPAKQQKSIDKQLGDHFKLLKVVTDTLFIRTFKK